MSDAIVNFSMFKYDFFRTMVSVKTNVILFFWLTFFYTKSVLFRLHYQLLSFYFQALPYAVFCIYKTFRIFTCTNVFAETIKITRLIK